MSPEDYFQSENDLNNYEIKTAIWDNTFIPDEITKEKAMNKVASTQQKIIDNLQAIRSFCEGVTELYNVDVHGDDYWTSYELPDGSYVDINIYVYADAPDEFMSAVAYPVDGAGNTLTGQAVTLKRIQL
jgi:hypothetical protein